MMEWVMIAIFASGIVTTDLTFDSAAACVDAASLAANEGYRAAAWERGDDLVLPQYSCVSVDG